MNVFIDVIILEKQNESINVVFVKYLSIINLKFKVWDVIMNSISDTHTHETKKKRKQLQIIRSSQIKSIWMEPKKNRIKSMTMMMMMIINAYAITMKQKAKKKTQINQISSVKKTKRKEKKLKLK